MKIVRYHTLGQRGARIGALVDQHVVHLGWVVHGEHLQPTGLDEDMVSFIKYAEDGQESIRHLVAVSQADARRLVPVAQVRILAPFVPTTILCAGSNYKAHNDEKMGAAASGQEPEFFVKTGDCVIGPLDSIVCDSRFTQKLDCETELAIVIGRGGRHIPIDRALNHVFGYSIVNDVTARDRQVRQGPNGSVWYDLGRGKVFDTSAPFGPCITTADDIPDPQQLFIRTRINGELRQAAHTAEMIWSCAELIHHFSVNMTLRAGMVIITGTPAGTAWSADPELGGKWAPSNSGEATVKAARYCQPGDTVVSEIEGIGALMNVVAQPRWA